MTLSYCTNVHPAEDLAGILAQLDDYAEPVRRRLGADRLGVGLWLAADVAAGLAEDAEARARLAAELRARGLEVHTLNAFPYGGFHQEVVKHAVYRPRWTERSRLKYTMDCATVLADLLPDGADHGSISTLPLGWRQPWSIADEMLALGAVDELTLGLRELHRRIGRPIRLAVEPEPGCVLDTVADAVDWLSGRVDPAYIGLCLDTCHLAVSFADPTETVAAVKAAGLDVVKVQASAALQVDRPQSRATKAALAHFDEPRYLHQVRELGPDQQVRAVDDLPQAASELPGLGPWRVHFHVPLHAQPVAPLRSTTWVLREAVTALRHGQEFRPHLEVETYTWSVLPRAGTGRATTQTTETTPRSDAELVDGIAAELTWATENLITDVEEV
ncbi:sugar phosphate isomerase/epimerase [Actinoalloteichus hoggarensis]|uniref:Xylose isomerase-like TIM barrel n=1 Tax=Actinoalloteichus hoggarensis TaxID=1470176 RepID=A0A221WBE5_9PSEU|nr:metabolite traffic protein EboE [Actinoalloteichus hoggarensis]ASO22597.1 Xylose isomerase-like TIM barrel [Actinoalloteichus hoggarensis]MBB5922978.1 sugar phosphate isomerase/epimerase [Actinoalloteichus hoggarensis]